MNIGELVNICAEGDVKQLKQRLRYLEEKGYCIETIINTPTSNGRTCLIAACRHGRLDVVKYLVERKVNVEQVGMVTFDQETVEGVPALWCAAGANHLEVVRFLVKNGANINQSTVTNSTALRAACFDGHHRVVRYLVENGADIEKPNRHGHTCLMIACFRGYENIARYLISRGARVNRRSTKGSTAVHDCSESGNMNCLTLLLQHGAFMRRDESGRSPVMSAANTNSRKNVDFLCDLRKPGHSGDSRDEFRVPIEEQAAARELLGANLFDRTQIQDAITEWHEAMKLRRRHFGYAKRLLPRVTSVAAADASDDPPDHYVWSLLGSRVVEAVREESENRRARQRVPLAPQRPPQPPPRAVRENISRARKYEERAVKLAAEYHDLLSQRATLSPPVGGESFRNRASATTTVVRSRELNRANLELAAAADAALGVEPQLRRPCYRRPLEGDVDDVSEQPSLVRDSTAAGASVSPFFSSRTSRAHDFPDASTTWWEDDSTSTPVLDDHHRMVRRVKGFSYGAFGQVREFSNASELHEVSQDILALHMQPLLIRLRILGPDITETVHFLCYRGFMCAESGEIAQCLSFWRYALEIQRYFLEPVCSVSQASFAAFAELFHIILDNRISGFQAVHVQPSLIVDCIDLAVESIERGIEYSYWNWHKRLSWSYLTADKEAINFLQYVCLCIHFASLICFYFLEPATADALLPRHDSGGGSSRRRRMVFSGRAFPVNDILAAVTSLDVGGGVADQLPLGAGAVFIPSESEHKTMRKAMTRDLTVKFFRILNRLLRVDPRVHEGQSVLHVACSPQFCRIGRALFPAPYADLLRLLCALGADPDAVDARGLTPVGVVFSGNLRAVNERLCADVIASLVSDGGAHVDACFRPPPTPASSPYDDFPRQVSSLQNHRLTDHSCTRLLRLVASFSQPMASHLFLRPLKCLAACALTTAQLHRLATLSDAELCRFVRLHHPP